MDPAMITGFAAGVAVSSSAVGLTAWVTAHRLLGRAEREAHTDALTGLLNRRGWERAAGARTNSTGGAQDLYVILADCNGLKQVNDVYGHEAGDELIADAAAALSAAAPGALVARLGGDEFALLATSRVFEALRARRAPVVAITEQAPGGDTVWSRIAMGAARFDGDLSEAMRRADAAMYRNKATGDGILCVFDPYADDHATADRPALRTRDLPARTDVPVHQVEVA
ncbi:GGDEF domain-containing protein [Glycomyces buryatensis]|nr:GGDEF domain-containing protein [Glycomyces buryatensis]